MSQFVSAYDLLDHLGQVAVDGNAELTVIAILFTMANPSANYVMAMSTGNNSNLAASGILLSTTMCLFTSMVAISVLRVLHFI